MDSYLDKPLATYLADAAARTSTPGGGSVAALAGALATTMASMAGNFSTGEKFAAVESQVLLALKSLEESRRKFVDLMHRDMDVYAALMATWRLPKATDAEKAARKAAIQAATKDSLLVPLEVTRVAIDVLQASQDLASIANANLLSDIAVAVILAEATYSAGRVNVEVNLAGLDDAAVVVSTRAELEAGQARAAMLKEKCLEAIAARKSRS
jgi:glutamate formiminotransferase/formiminotetrahydrofolate cyclodeaminase